MPKVRIQQGFLLLVYGIILIYIPLPLFFLYYLIFREPSISIINPLNIIFFALLILLAIKNEIDQPFLLNYSSQGKRGRLQRTILLLIFLSIIFSKIYIVWLQYANPEIVDAFYNYYGYLFI